MSYRPALFGLMATFACALCPGAIHAAAAPGINPTADTFVSSANPGSNYGAAGSLEVSATSSANGEFDSFLRFNLGSTLTYFNGLYGAGNWTVQSITLTLTATKPNNAIFNASAAGTFAVQLNNSDAWVEGTGSPMAPDTNAADLDYNNHTTYESAADPILGIFTFAGGTSGTNTYSLTLAGGLLADVQNGSDASLYVSAADSAVSYLFNSTNFGTASARPVLVVNAVPEPGVTTVCGGALGLLAFVYARGRRQA